MVITITIINTRTKDPTAVTEETSRFPSLLPTEDDGFKFVVAIVHKKIIIALVNEINIKNIHREFKNGVTSCVSMVAINMRRRF